MKTMLPRARHRWLAIASLPLVITLTSGALTAQSRHTISTTSIRNITVDADPVRSGSVQQTLQVSIPPDVASLAGVPTVPDGWTLEYTEDGATWSSTAPASPSAVRATGTVESLGTSGEFQVLESEAEGVPVSVTGWAQPTSAGDGWDVFFGLGRIFNVWHHTETYVGVDCHERTTALPCWTLGGMNTPFVLYGYQSPNHSTGFIHESSRKLWTLARKISDGTAGFICVDLDDITNPESCSTEYVPLTSAGATVSWQNLGDASRIGNEVFFRLTSTNSSLYCLNLSTGTACTGQPYAAGGSSGLPVGIAVYDFNRSFALNNLLFVNSSTDVGCFDPVSDSSCPGTWPVSVSQMGAIFTKFDSLGDEVGICGIAAQACFDFLGASSTFPAGLATALNDYPQSWFWNEWAGLGSPNTLPRYYWTIQADHTKMQCYDFTTDAVCAGFTIPSLGLRTYGVREDPADPGCLWTNSDVGQVVAFNGTTGTTGCNVIDAVLTFPVEQLSPRNRCDGSTAISAWTRLKVDLPAGIDHNDVIVTVRNSSGDLITDWTSKTINGAGVLNLANLDPAITGDSPQFTIQALNTDDATGISGTLRYESLPAQICVPLMREIVCPEDPDVPVVGAGERFFGAYWPDTSQTEESSSYRITALSSGCDDDSTTTTVAPPESVPGGSIASTLPPTGANPGTTSRGTLLATILLFFGCVALTYSVRRARI